jgi:hypothetical protein
MQNNKFKVVTPHVTMILSLAAVICNLTVAFPTLFAQTNEGEGQTAALNETQDETFSLITLNAEQISEIRSNLNKTRQAIESGNTTEALINLTIIDEQFSALGGEPSTSSDFKQ